MYSTVNDKGSTMASPGPLFHVGDTSEDSPFYALQFDKSGLLENPLTAENLLKSLQGEPFTDVFLFCHGWNNDWAAALEKYKGIIEQYQQIASKYDLELGREYRPLFAGIFWPSTAMVWPWEEGPNLATTGPAPSIREAVESLAAEIPEGNRARFYYLAEVPELDRGEGKELAKLVAGIFSKDFPELEGEDETVTSDDLLAAWAALEEALAGPQIPKSPFIFTSAGVAEEPGAVAPKAAGAFGTLSPRNILRALTVRQMKDRAGVVGARGVGPWIREAQLASETARFHLLGHSYGARVLLNAVARPEGAPLPRPVDSLLLLQPAVNYLCFANELPQRQGASGAYRNALTQVRLPILSTFSPHDFPLTKIFHLALCREKDIGDIAVGGPIAEPPNQYAALGGYGPRGEVPWQSTPTKLPKLPQPQDEDYYQLGPEAPRVWALDGTDSIRGHGDVISPTTVWALLNLVHAA